MDPQDQRKLSTIEACVEGFDLQLSDAIKLAKARNLIVEHELLICQCVTDAFFEFLLIIFDKGHVPLLTHYNGLRKVAVPEKS